MLDLETVLMQSLQDAEAGWSMGSFGVIAEFHQDPGESAQVVRPLARATDRGAIAIDGLEGVVPVPFESLSRNPQRWGQAVALCLPEQQAARARRAVLTELGPDTGAVRPQDMNACLFDMGLDQPQVDFCVRTSDPALVEVLRRCEGLPVFGKGSAALSAILQQHPHRVALTAIGRVEVFQKIGGPDTGGVSPPGPHTHVLPKLMAAGRTHSANTPIPAGLWPCASLHPQSPTMTPMGEDRDFDPDAFERFQALLEAWDASGYRASKLSTWAAIENKVEPENSEQPDNRIARMAVRNAIRQLARQHGSGPLIARWSAAFDQGAVDFDADAPGH